MSSRPLAALLAGAAVGGALLVAPPASAASCAVTWGSLAKAAASTSAPLLTGVRAGQQPCWDRVVVDLGPGAAPGWIASYVTSVRAEGTGAVVPTRGGAALQLVVRAPAYGGAGAYVPRTPSELVAVGGYRTLRQVAWAGSFEGQTTLGIGVRARLPFRVFTLPSTGGGSRVVVDVAHTW